MICIPNTECPENWVHIRPMGGVLLPAFPENWGSAAENVILKGESAAKRCIPSFFARQTVLYYNSIGACRKGSKPVRFTQGSVSRARCTEKAVF